LLILCRAAIYASRIFVLTAKGDEWRTTSSSFMPGVIPIRNIGEDSPYEKFGVAPFTQATESRIANAEF